MKKFPLKVAFCIILLIFLPFTVLAVNDTNPQASKIIKKFSDQLKADTNETISNSRFEVFNDGNSASTGFIYPFNDKKFSTVEIALSLGYDHIGKTEAELKELNFQKLTIDGIDIFIRPDIDPRPTINAGDTFVYYASSSYLFCEDFTLISNASASLSDNDVNPTNLDLVDKWSQSYFAKAIKSAGGCDNVTETIFNKNISVEILKISGEVEISKGGVNNFKPAKIGDVLAVGDYISTGFDSNTVIRIKNVAELKIDSNTNFSISQLLYDDNIARTAIKLQAGKIVSNVKPEKGVKASFQIVTPTSTIGVRGTEFETSFDEQTNSTYVYVTEGTVNVTNDNTKESMDITANQYAYISSSGNIELNNMDIDFVTQEADYTAVAIVSIAIFCVTSILFILSIILFIKKKWAFGCLFLFLQFILIIVSIFIIGYFLPDQTRIIKEPLNSITPLPSPNQVEAEATPSQQKQTNFTFAPDKSFKINLGDYSSKITFAKDTNDWSEASYIGCYKIENSDYNDGICPFQSVEVFRINLYSPDSINEINQNPTYEGAYISIYEFADTGAYLLEWPNGFYPDGVTGMNYQYFESIAPTFTPIFE